jgi:hypothetical protein
MSLARCQFWSDLVNWVGLVFSFLLVLAGGAVCDAYFKNG